MVNTSLPPSKIGSNSLTAIFVSSQVHTGSADPPATHLPESSVENLTPGGAEGGTLCIRPFHSATTVCHQSKSDLKLWSRCTLRLVGGVQHATHKDASRDNDFSPHGKLCLSGTRVPVSSQTALGSYLFQSILREPRLSVPQGPQEHQQHHRAFQLFPLLRATE